MRYTILFSLLLVSTWGFSKGKLSAEDTANVNRMIRDVIPLIKVNRDSALNLNKAAYRKSLEIGYEQGIADAGWILGTHEMKQGHHKEAYQYYQYCIRYYTNTSQTAKLAKVMALAGVSEGLQNNSAKALKWFLKADKVAEELKDDHLKAEIRYKIGLVYGQVNDISNAILYARQSLQYALRTNDEEMQATVYNNLGIFYGQNKQYKEALEVLMKGRAIASRLSSPAILPDLFLNMGIASRESGQYNMARLYLDSAYTFYGGIKFPARIASSATAIADLLVKQEKYDEAWTYIGISMQYAKGVNDENLLLENDLLLHQIYTAKGRYKQAAGLFDTIIALQKLFDNAEERASVEKIGMAVEVQKALDEVKTIRKEKALKTKQLNLLTALSCVSIVFVIVCACGVLYIRKKNKELVYQKQELAFAGTQKDKIFSVISHDLRSPLTSIVGSLELLEDTALKQEDRLSLIKNLRLSVSATLETLDNLLRWGMQNLKNNTSHTEAVDISKLAAQTNSLLTNVAAQKSIRLVNTIDEVCIARFDKAQLAFIMRNLMLNAIKFSHEGQEVALSGRKDNDRIILEVKDNGVGMSEEVRKKVFGSQEYFSSNGTAGERGVGLGLALVKEFLAKNNGEMTITSKEGIGSCFKVSIPAV